MDHIEVIRREEKNILRNTYRSTICKHIKKIGLLIEKYCGLAFRSVITTTDKSIPLVFFLSY